MDDGRKSRIAPYEVTLLIQQRIGDRKAFQKSLLNLTVIRREIYKFSSDGPFGCDKNRISLILTILANGEK